MANESCESPHIRLFSQKTEGPRVLQIKLKIIQAGMFMTETGPSESGIQ